MKKEKTFGTRFVEGLLLVAGADVASILLKFLIQLLSAPIRSELDARNSDAALSAVNLALAGLCLAGFLALLAVMVIVNPAFRSDYLIRTYGTKYSFSTDFVQTVKSRALPDLLAGGLLGLPLNLVLQFVGDINYLPTVFPPFYAAWELTGNAILSWVILTVLIPVWLTLITCFAHYKWEKNRIRK